MAITLKNNYESMEDMRRMQQEAIMRVQEMQKRAKKSLEVGHQTEPNMNLNKSKPNIPAPIHNINPPDSKKNLLNSLTPFPISNIFDMFFKDTEKSLLLVLVLLLVEENSDIGLILALMYLIM